MSLAKLTKFPKGCELIERNLLYRDKITKYFKDKSEIKYKKLELRV